jgi:hypothetical protein
MMHDQNTFTPLIRMTCVPSEPFVLTPRNP